MPGWCFTQVMAAEALAVPECWPAPSVQATDPLADLYFPATQAEHGSVTSPVYSALQPQML